MLKSNVDDSNFGIDDTPQARLDGYDMDSWQVHAIEFVTDFLSAALERLGGPTFHM